MRVVNAAARRMFGYAHPVDLVGQPVMRYSAPEHREAVETRVSARLQAESLRSVTKLANAVGDRPELRRRFEPGERAVQRIAR